MDYDGWTCAKIVSYSAGNSPNYSTTGFVVVGYTCPAGTTLSGASCLTSVTTAATIASYTCPAGRNLVGNGCVLPGATFAGYACSTGTLNGNNCIVATTSTIALGSSNASDRTLSFLYGPEHQRIKQNVTLSGNGTSAYFSGNTWYLNGEDSLGLTYEKEVRTNGTTEHKHYVNAAGFTFALFTSRTGTLNGLAAATTSYFHKDHLGSVSVIADETGAVTERLAYDPWGKRRFINSTPGLTDKLDANVGVKTDRGYTEHEHLDEVGVIHMNGRVYDPLMGRFMSADPFVQSPVDLRSFNRYSYVWNTPLRMFDPTGYNATHDSESGAGYGSSNGAHDPTGVGGISNGYPEGQYGGNSQKTYSESISLSLKKSADDCAANQQNQFAQPGVDLALAKIRFFGPFGWVDAMCDVCAPIWGPVRPQDPTEPRETNQTGLKLPTVSMPGVLGFIQSGLSALNVVQSEGADNVPSNVGPGPNAGESVPAGPSPRPTKEQQDKINEIGNRDGCHTCGTKDPGTKSGNWVGDHQDPTKLNPEGKPQRYYPQCRDCSNEQGGRIRWLPRP